MRSLLTRMALVGAVGIALSGCGNASGTSFSPGGNPNGTGGGNTFVGAVGGTSSTLSPIIIDDGTVAKGAYTGFDTTATDTQSATSYAAPLDTGDAGSHAISFAGNNLTQVIFKYGTAVPNLTYQTGVPGNTSFASYSTVSFYLGYTPAATAPGKTPTVSLELTGSASAASASTSSYDVRVACTGTAAATPSLFKCTLPAYGASANTAGPNAVNPTASGLFTPVASTLYIVLNYGSGTNAASTGNVLAVDSVQATP